MTYGEVIKLVDRGSVVNMIFLDSSKAFDVVNYFIIITKLQMLDIGGDFFSWIRGFYLVRQSLMVGGKMNSFK